ncbi:restriction endonuclease subunit S, partial [Pseudomonas avellanae]
MPGWFQVVSDRSGGTTHKRVSRGALGRIRIKLPKLREQSSIASILSTMGDEITTLVYCLR